MSFYSGTRNSFCPGPLNGNPLNGLCEKACIHTKKVFDACLRQMQESGVNVTVSNFTPANPAEPLTFVSVSCVSSGVTINNLIVDRFEDKPCFARVSGTVAIPLEVRYVDANGVSGVATGEYSVNTDVVLYVPQPSIVPFTIEAFASCLSPDGEYVGIYSGDTPIAFYTDHINLTFYEGQNAPSIIDTENPLYGDSACCAC